jgi:hypothetical protein
MPLHWYGIFAAVVSASIQLVVFLRWLHRRMRDDEINRVFIRDVATNHLPHIYSALHQIAAEKGIELQEPPLVRFVDLSTHGPRRHR